MYRIIVSIIRGTNAGRALSLMSHGMQCSAETREKGQEYYEEYLDAASAVLGSVPKDICMGTITLLNTKEGHIVFSEVLMGKF